MTVSIGLLEKNAEQLPLEALISHIIWRYHDTHRRELPELMRLASQADSAHVLDGEPNRLSPILHVIAKELEHHMAEEEQILFPLILSGPALKLEPPIKHILAEHEHHEALVLRLEQLALDWKAFECDATVAELLEKLRKFVSDMHQHLDLESRVLFAQFAQKGKP
jgi:regulator of cell morphogenesis and NO signaling